jgi:hypothetical protein
MGRNSVKNVLTTDLALYTVVDPAAERVQRKWLKLSAGQFIYSFGVGRTFFI